MIWQQSHPPILRPSSLKRAQLLADCPRNRVSVVVDAADYFHYVRELCEEAQNLLLFIGWDFDSRISLEPGDRSRRAWLSAFSCGWRDAIRAAVSRSSNGGSGRSSSF
jgi:hypothetical protein